MSITDIKAPPSTEKPDWFLNSIRGKLPANLETLRDQGVFVGAFNLRDKEDYWGLDEIKQAFTDKEGNVQRSQFDDYYRNLDTNFKNNLEVERFTMLNDNAFATKYAESLGNYSKLPIVVEAAPDVNGRFYNSNRLEAEKFGSKAYGVRENAVANGVIDENGNKMTIDEWESNEQGFWTGVLKFAKDDKGRWLRNEDGDTYLTTVKPGEKLNSFDEIYSPFSDITGRYGTGEGFWQGAGGFVTSIVKAPTNVAVSTIDGILTAIEASSDALGYEGSDFEKTIVDLRNRVNSSRIGMSEKGMENWTSLESLVGMTADGVMQLIQMMTGVGALKAIGMGTKMSSFLPMLNMGMVGGAGIYDLAREKGFTAREAAALYGLGVAGLTALARMDDVLIKSIMGNSQIATSTIGGFAKHYDILVGGSLSKASLQAVYKNFPQIFTKISSGTRGLSKFLPDSGIGLGLASGAREGVQEFSEQAFETGVKKLGNIYSELMYDGQEGRADFQINMDQEIQSWKQAAVGGILTGSVAPFVMRTMYGKNPAPDSDVTQVFREVVNGRAKNIYKIIDRLHKEGRLAPAWENADGQYINQETAEDGQNLSDSEKAERDKNATYQVNSSKNDIAATILRSNIKAIEELVESKGFKNFATDQQINFGGQLKQMTNFDALKIAIGLGEKNEYNINGKALYEKYTTSGRDASKLLAYINKLDGELANYGKDGANVDEQLVEQTKNKRKELQSRLDRIKRGELTKDYVAEGLYNMMSFQTLPDNSKKDTGGLDLADVLNPITGKSYVSLNNGVTTDAAKIKEQATKAFNKQQELDNTVNLTSDSKELVGISNEKKQELLIEANDNLLDSSERLLEVFEANENDTPDGISQVFQNVDAYAELEDNQKAILDKYEEDVNTLQKITSVSAETKLPIAPMQEEDVRLNQFLNTIEDSDESEISFELKKSGSIPLETIIADEEALFKNKPDEYIEFEQVDALINIINQRQAQVIATRLLNDHNLDNIQTLTEKQSNDLIKKLDTLKLKAAILSDRARYNAENPELAIRNKAMEKVKAITKNLDDISDDYARSGLPDAPSEIVDEIITSRLKLYEAIEAGDIAAHQKELNRLEDKIYAIGSRKIIELLKPLKPDNLNELSVNEKLAYKRKYDYLLGVLSLQSSKFYDIYHETFVNNPDGLKPSIEQRLIIKEAVQKASIRDYNIDGFDSVDIDARRYQNTVLIDGGGGSGKTTVVSPAIAAILSKLNNKKIFTTSVDIGNKISNSVDSLNSFGKKLNIYKGSKKTIEDLFNSPEELKDIGVIVFDEVTLLNIYSLEVRKQNAGVDAASIIEYGLQDIIDKLNAHNQAFENNKVKLVYTGDSRQNIKNLPEENKNMGIHSVHARIPKTDRIKFSFRSQNRPLIKLAEYFEKSQSKYVGFLKDVPVLTNSYETVDSIINDDKVSHKRRVGVTIINEDGSFANKVNKYVNSLPDNEKSNTVYITDDTLTTPSAIVENNIKVLSPIEAQGEEWNNVIINLTNKEAVSTERPTYASKKAYYTAVTRAKNYVMMNLPSTQKLKSQSGTVVKSKTLELPNNTRADELLEIEEILGREVKSNVIADISSNVELPSSKQEDLSETITDNIGPVELSTNPINALNNFLEGFREKAIQLHTFYTIEHPDKTMDEVHALKSKLLHDKSDKFYSYNLVIAKRNSPEYRNVVKNDPSYNRKYALLLEGVDNSPNSGKFNKTILGIYSDKVGSEVFDDRLEDVINNNNMFPNGATSRVIALDGSVFTVNGIKTAVRGVSVRGAKVSTSVEDMYNPENSPGIVRGDIKILQQNIVDANGKIKQLAGSAFIPTSYKYRTPEEINSELEKAGHDNIIEHPYIKPIFIRGDYLSPERIVALLSPFAEDSYFDESTGKTYANFPKKQKAGSLFNTIYDSVFGRLTFSGSRHGDLTNTRDDVDSRKVTAYFNRGVKGIYDKLLSEGNRSTDYAGFVREWLADGTLPDETIKNAFDTSFIALTDEASAILEVGKDNKITVDPQRSSKPYFFMQQYVEAELRGPVNKRHQKRLKFFKTLLEDLQQLSLTVPRLNQTTGKIEVLPKNIFERGFQTSVVGISGVDYDASPFLPSTDSLHKDNSFYDKHFIIDNAEYISLPSVNVNVGNLIDLLGNKGTIIQDVSPATSVPSTPSITSIKNADVEIGSDMEQMRTLRDLDPISSPIQEDVDKYKIGKSLTEFQEKHYPGNNNLFVEESIYQFKNRIWNALFTLKGTTPEMHDVTDPKTINAVRNFLNSELENSLTDAKLNNSLIRSNYHNQVHAVEFDFLMNKYFSSLKKVVDENNIISYKSEVTDFKSNVYNRETDTILDDTMNEMVETMLNNTKMLYYEVQPDGTRILRERLGLNGVPQYIDKEAIEDLTPYFQNNLGENNIKSVADITSAMKEHIESSDINAINPAVLSVYHQFFALEPYMMGSELTNSFARIDNTSLAQEMVEGFISLVRTTDIVKYATLNLGNENGMSGIPSAQAGAHVLLRELIVRDMSLNALDLAQRLTYDSTKQEYKFIALDDTDVIISRAFIDNSRENLVKIFQELGVTHFTDNVYEELLKTKGLDEKGVQNALTNIALDMLNRVNESRKLSDSATYNKMSGMITAQFNNYIINPIKAANGLHTNTMHVNAEGNLVGRLRNKILTLRLQAKIKEFRKSPDGVFSNNMFVKLFSQNNVDSYRLSDWVNKDGIKYETDSGRNTKPHTKFTTREHFIHDIQYSFYEQLKKTDTQGTSFKVVMSTLLFGDSGAEVMPVISLNRLQLSNPKLVLKAFFDSQATAYDKINKSNAYSKEFKDQPTFQKKLNTFTKGNFDTYESIIDTTILNDVVAKFEANAPLEVANIKNEIEKSGSLNAYGINDFTGLMKAYVYNWIAISTELSDLSIGKFEQFKGKTESQKYVDYSKRFKMQVSSRGDWIYRNENWSPEIVNGEITDKSLLEGRKLNTTGNVIFINDEKLDEELTRDTGVRRLTTLDLSRQNEVQKILDGATFTNPITRIYQRASAGGRFGMPTPVVAKPVTNSTNFETGQSIGIKNAEFELTAHIMRNATIFTKKMMNNMLRGDVGNDKTIKDILVDVVNEGIIDKVTNEEIIKPIEVDELNVYDYVQDMHFREVADRLVIQNKQDVLIHEIIPTTSKKYGPGYENDINEDVYKTTEISFLDKGQQLDASHNVTDKNDIKLVTQFVNAAAINGKSISALQKVYNAIGELARITDERWDEQNSNVADDIRTLTKEAIEKRLSITYQHSLVNSGGEWSLMDRQILKTSLGQLNSNIEKKGVRINLFGGQYVLHPQGDIISLRRVQLDNGSTRVYLKSEVPDDANIILNQDGSEQEADLEFIEPSIEIDGVLTSLSQHPEYVIFKSQYNNALKSVTDKAKREVLLHQFQENIDAILNDGDWNVGYVETLLPMSVGNQFKITQDDVNTIETVDGFDADFFLAKINDDIIENKSSLSDKEFSRIISDNFQDTLKLLNVRIPTTGKHSALVSKIAGFMEGENNNIYVSPMLLFITGADQDIDKGNIIIPQAVNGIIPRVDEDFNFDIATESFFTETQKREGLTLKDALNNPVLNREGKPIHLNLLEIALTNSITEGLIEISESPKNTIESTSAIEASLKKMRQIVENKRSTYKRDSYADYIKLKKEIQTGANLISVFANHQKVYQVLYAYEILSPENVTVGLNIPAGLDRISETFAAFVNAATDNANEQILGPLGITENNASIVSYLVIEGKTIEEIYDILQNPEYREDLTMLESKSDYDQIPPGKQDFKSKEFYDLYLKGKELNLINSVIMNRRLPNSPYDMQKAVYNITRQINIRVNGERYDHQKFLLDDSGEYAKDAIEAMDKAVEVGTYRFNILRLANPFDNTVPANYYNKLFARTLKIKNDEFSILKHTDNLLLFSKQALGKYNSIQEYEYAQALDFMYGLGIHNYLAETNSDGLSLGNMVERTKWVQKMNEEIIPNMIANYNSSGNPNYFLNSLFRDEVTMNRYSKKSMVWRLPDIREVSETTALSYKVAFNTSLDKESREKLILYNWITVGGKFGKGSFAQIIDNNSLMQSINTSIAEQFNNMSDEDVRSLISVYEDFKKGNIEDGKLLPNAIPYASPEEIQGKVRTDNPLNVGNNSQNDALISGLASAFTQDKVRNRALRDIINEFQVSNRPKGPVIENVTKIISAGNTGVESIILSTAKGLGIPTGGITRGDITKRPNEEFVNKFGLEIGDINSIINNIKDSDVTIMFGADKDSNNEDVLHQAKNQDKPIIIVSNTLLESDKTKTKIDKLLNNYKNVFYVNSSSALRAMLKNYGYSELNVTGPRKLSSTAYKKAGYILREALTENLYSSYVSVKNSVNESITIDAKGNYTYYPNNGNDSELVKNVYYSSDITIDTQARLKAGEITLIPIIIGENNQVIQIDNKAEVDRLRDNNENIALGVFANGVYTNVAHTLNSNPKIGDFTIFQNADSNAFKTMSGVSFINNGTSEIESTSATLDIKGSNSSSKIAVKYHGKLNKFEVMAKLGDIEYVEGLNFSSETERKHVFTGFQIGVIEANTFMVEIPTTYDFDVDGNLPIEQDKAAWKHAKMLAVKGDADAAFSWRDEFTNEGKFFTELYDFFDNRFNQFQKKRINQHSRLTREALITGRIAAGNAVIESRIKEDVLKTLLDDAGYGELSSTVMNSIFADISTYLTKAGLTSYSRVFNSYTKINYASRKAVQNKINSVFKTLEFTDKVSKTKTSTKSNNGKGVEKNTSKVFKSTGADKIKSGSYKYYMQRIEFAKSLSDARRATEVDNLFKEIARSVSNFKSTKQKNKLLAELKALDANQNYTNNLAAFFKTDLTRGENVRPTPRINLTISKKGLPKFRALLGRLKYELTLNNPQLTDAATDGKAIIDILKMALDSDNTTDFDKQFAKSLISQYEGIQKDMSNEEIQDIMRFCAKLKV